MNGTYCRLLILGPNEEPTSVDDFNSIITFRYHPDHSEPWFEIRSVRRNAGVRYHAGYTMASRDFQQYRRTGVLLDHLVHSGNGNYLRVEFIGKRNCKKCCGTGTILFNAPFNNSSKECDYCGGTGSKEWIPTERPLFPEKSDLEKYLESLR